MEIRDKDRIIGFLDGSLPDYKGRHHKDILAFSDEELESCHDQIQWMFPLHEGSKFAETCPILTKEVVGLFGSAVLENIMLAVNRMVDFYGLGEEPVTDKHKEWCVNGNHNLLRITRMIRCLRLVGLDEEALSLYLLVMEVGVKTGIDPVTMMYWSKALFDDEWETLR